ncbi:MAG: GMP synthase (glutamine-hydrolyzing) [Oceanicoccus sp.]|jgi:GMP synthase (glutamine-hydrolysing)
MNKIAILDFGSQFAHLLANRVRRLGVYSEILDPETDSDVLREYSGIILSGGPASVNDPKSPQIHAGVFELGIPILGICYGHQITMHKMGGRVKKGTVGEYGLTTFNVHESRGVLSKLKPGKYQVYASHFDSVAEVPEGFEVLGSTPDDEFTATMNEEKKIYTIQFHPEVSHSEGGMDILDSFIDITGAKRDWSIDKFIEMEIAAINEKVGDKKVFLLISGGVDSSVTYVLLAKAMGAENIYAMYVDTGFMRKNETEEIQAFLKEAGVKDLHTYDAKERYFKALEGITDPETKRKIIGDMFLEIQREVSAELGLNPEEWLLGQGTIYPDTIESGGTKNADKIKTHHNRVPEIEELIKQGKIIEPIKELYKDEVRMVGRKLGLPDKMIDRHPFPGPGLAVRILCLDEASPVDVDIDAGDYRATALPVKSVGVQGDERTYRHPVALEGPADWDALRSHGPKLTNTYNEINRVLYTIAIKEGEKIETVSATPGTLTRERTAKLQEADKLVMETIYRIDTDKKVWQCPTVLLPLSVNSEGMESIVLRPVSSIEAMTANFTELQWEAIQELAQDLLKIPGISAVFYDITNKPPGTIEWE